MFNNEELFLMLSRLKIHIILYLDRLVVRSTGNLSTAILLPDNVLAESKLIQYLLSEHKRVSFTIMTFI